MSTTFNRSVLEILQEDWERRAVDMRGADLPLATSAKASRAAQQRPEARRRTGNRLTPEQRARIYVLRDEGLPMHAIAERLGCSSATVAFWLGRAA